MRLGISPGVGYRLLVGREAIHQYHPRHYQQQAHDGAPIQCLLKNQVSEQRDEKNPQPRPRGIYHRDRQRIQGEGQTTKRGRLAPNQGQCRRGASKVLGHGQQHGPAYFQRDRGQQINVLHDIGLPLSFTGIHTFCPRCHCHCPNRNRLLKPLADNDFGSNPKKRPASAGL